LHTRWKSLNLLLTLNLAPITDDAARTSAKILNEDNSILQMVKMEENEQEKREDFFFLIGQFNCDDLERFQPYLKGARGGSNLRISKVILVFFRAFSKRFEMKPNRVEGKSFSTPVRALLRNPLWICSAE
jgi:hypothetical protein